MLFNVSTKLGVEFIEKEICLTPEFEAVYIDDALGLNAFRFIVMTQSYLSPYRSLSESERNDAAAIALFKKKRSDLLGNKKMVAAINKFNELQFDGDYMAYYSVDEQIQSLAKYLHKTKATAGQVEEIKKAAEAMTKLSELKAELKSVILEKVKIGEGNIIARGDKKLTYMEKRFTAEDELAEKKIPVSEDEQ